MIEFLVLMNVAVLAVVVWLVWYKSTQLSNFDDDYWDVPDSGNTWATSTVVSYVESEDEDDEPEVSTFVHEDGSVTRTVRSRRR